MNHLIAVLWWAYAGFTISDIRMRLVSNSGDVGVIRLAGFMFEFDVVEAHATAYMELHRVMFSLYACT